MFYYLISSLPFRVTGAALLSLVLGLWLGKIFIRKFKRAGWVDYVRSYTPENHKAKRGIPTLGGIFILISLLASLLIFGKLTSRFLLLSLFVILYLGLLGFWDDAIKKAKRSSQGLKTRFKLLIQLILACFVAFYLYREPGFSKYLEIPFSSLTLNIGWVYIPLIIAIIVATPNSVNLTDGLDGLAAGCVLFAGIAYGILSFFAGSALFSSSLNITYIFGARELVVFWAAVLGATFAFFWYNTYPAQVFMGETGTQILGGALAITAILIKKEILLLLIGGVFAVEALSVFLQVFFFQTRGKRILKMSPLHHHYELKGISEPKIVTRFWIIALLLALLGLSSVLKL